MIRLKNIECTYRGAVHPSLRIDDLTVERNELTFVVGASGAGKSTMLELLGLMNNSARFIDGEQSEFQFVSNAGTKFDLLPFWTAWKREQMAAFRAKYFAFIFQQVNMFPSLSVWDNLLIPSLDAGLSESSARRNINLIAEKLVPTSVLQAERIMHVSGGQRQRLAFLRAFASPHELLLADEPTGNLDVGNARILMQLILNSTREASKSAIVVSHDIPLAIQFADRIILLVREAEAVSGTGVYKRQNDFKRLHPSNLWREQAEFNTFSSEELQSKLVQHFLSNAENQV